MRDIDFVIRLGVTGDEEQRRWNYGHGAYHRRMKDAKIDKSKFDTMLRALINAPPTTFKEVVAQPKPRKDGGMKRSARKSGKL
jgi:hypothetical protein